MGNKGLVEERNSGCKITFKKRKKKNSNKEKREIGKRQTGRFEKGKKANWRGPNLYAVGPGRLESQNLMVCLHFQELSLAQKRE